MFQIHCPAWPITFIELLGFCPFLCFTVWLSCRRCYETPATPICLGHFVGSGLHWHATNALGFGYLPFNVPRLIAWLAFHNKCLFDANITRYHWRILRD
ncbi:hypothetical protein VFPPC_16654 [Pochonia chlamydosporia 170]|uniref:Uncharacterized protein n=1 Tax=Pochonia chlamydosporia 170 TaxID=1380566 RepID=A0A179FAC2_METCM|nr:hypothetical protein VFPPC_16654 [Pochonia chlamydosporia 170]OAQ62414.1 hypothetical protein VFPPC_16654 [Pochonia chlamydosporia 170]